jgi:predicted O-linked N-acetylglucosamine transferase (SPINDLY family)
VLLSLGKNDEAVKCFRRALQLKPDFVVAHSNLIFCLDMAPSADLSELLQERKRWDERHAARFLQAIPYSNTRSPDRLLRIGYVSADFRNHSASKAFGAMLTRYDRGQFEVFAYSNYKGEDDRYTRLFRQNATGWRNISAMSDEAATQQIREDRIDILVDLSGHSAGNRLLVFARKPAPVQITAWGYAAGTGMRAMDVFFTDKVIVPPEEQRFYSEEVRYLPSALGSFFIDPFPDLNELPALNLGSITFGSFNRLAKISGQTYRTWAQILLQIQGSRLILKTPELNERSNRERILSYFENAGLDADRIVMLGGSSWFEHMRAYQEVDIALDPFPHGGGMTAMEGLMMGVPVITLNWPILTGRLSSSLMTTLGLQDWIVQSEDQYLELAIKKSAQLPQLSVLRQTLRALFSASIIGDQGAYTRVVEQEYRALWQAWCVSAGEQK